ncbi:hypothetical protein CEXT_481921 [Caerostris extrusa]|uniref:Uncharacterized protein n=1 Tax=Caerostris extrusa TaxID=172846 RepID=A0AAV4UEX2_CAEEX|nr:hypothetical protein CEXT_481921 [Caerostris extrusa]
MEKARKDFRRKVLGKFGPIIVPREPSCPGNAIVFRIQDLFINRDIGPGSFRLCFRGFRFCAYCFLSTDSEHEDIIGKKPGGKAVWEKIVILTPIRDCLPKRGWRDESFFFADSRMRQKDGFLLSVADKNCRLRK